MSPRTEFEREFNEGGSWIRRADSSSIAVIF